MIALKIDDILQKTGKNISELAREIGVNRNTMQALASGKVNGIKFETLEKLCRTYQLQIGDILEFTDGKKVVADDGRLYKQEGECIPFTAFPWLLAASEMKNIGRPWLYFKNHYTEVFWEEAAMRATASAVFNRYADHDAFRDFYGEFRRSCIAIESLYHRAFDGETTMMSEDQLLAYFHEVKIAYHDFWLASLFIDCFDAGFDRDKIREIAERFRLTIGEVQVLTTPEEMAFTSERRFRLLRIATGLQDKEWSTEQLLRFVQTSPEIVAYRRDFDYFASTYATVKHITNEDVAAEIAACLAEPERFTAELHECEQYGQDRHAAMVKVLRAHKMKENPLWFFARLTMWREVRKQVNLMGIHALHAILDRVEAATGIPHKYLQYLTFDELPLALRGLVTMDELKKRREQGVMLSVDGKRFTLLRGEEVASLLREFNERLATSNNSKVISGQTASQGYAKGIARVILDASEFHRFNEGEVLVTGMTRPEFVPIMKKAAAIVTNEGGITCHAAIVSRELGKPCIIGTKNATKLIADGALIEVRANHGTVRVLG